MSHEQQETENAALSLVKEFFAAKERHDLDATMSLFSEDAVYIFPLPASGKQENWFTYKGKEAVTKYQGQVLERFKQIKMLAPRYFVTTDGSNVFAESRGDYITQDGTAYNNVYIFKFVIRGGKIAEGYEYANPVTYAKLAGLAIG
jgi:ketosteroid isomerase-like protein